MQKESYNNIKNNLYKVTSYYALQDYKQANKTYKPYTNTFRPAHPKPYNLSDTTLEAHELYCIMSSNTAETLTFEQEESIKIYLMRVRFLTNILN